VLRLERPAGPARRIREAARGGLAGDAGGAGRAGWRNYSLFLRQDGLLVGYLETPDFADALAAMEATDVNARWQAEMAPFFELPEGARPDTGLERLTEIFHLA
jgi:L-rhamnose mutarotase